MNERIKQLAEQAGYTTDMFGVGHWDMPECQKFAELIVQECAEVAHCNFHVDGLTLGGIMKKHFGVDE
jgi:hypothetical protein